MVRGGRSWPPEWKAGTGAVSAGNVTKDVRPGCPRDGTEPTMEAMQQPLAQKWQVAGCSPEDESSSTASATASWWCVAECSACIAWTDCTSWCPCSARTSAVLVPSPSGQSIVAATAPRMGSNAAKRMRMKMRRCFTVVDYRADGLCVQGSRSSIRIVSIFVPRCDGRREA